MTAAAATLPAPERRWTPLISPAAYDRRVALSREERRALALIADRPRRWPAGVAEALSRLTRPINDVLAVAGLKHGSWAGAPTRGELLAAMGRERSAFWAWDRPTWQRTVEIADVNVRQLVIAVAYQLCGITDLHWEIRGFKCSLFCRRVFGAAAVEETVGRVQAHLDTLGYAAQLRRPNLQRGLCELMLAARSPRLDDLAGRGELLVELRAREQHNARRAGIEQLARTLVDMNVLAEAPFGALPTREEWLERSRAGALDVPERWLDYAQRWFLTSTLSRSSRTQTYFCLIKVGRWLAQEHPDRADPASWDRELAAAWVGRVDRMLVGEFSRAPNTDYMRRRSGGQLLPRTKAHLMWSPRRFFNDIQEWEWIERRFDARRAFALPRSIRALIGPAPTGDRRRGLGEADVGRAQPHRRGPPAARQPRRDRNAVVSARARPRDHDDVAVLRAADRRDHAPTPRRDPLATTDRPGRRPIGSACSTCRRTRPRPHSPSRSTRSSATRSKSGNEPGRHTRSSPTPRPASSSISCSASAARGSARTT